LSARAASTSTVPPLRLGLLLGAELVRFGDLLTQLGIDRDQAVHVHVGATRRHRAPDEIGIVPKQGNVNHEVPPDAD
jgi:hypothetical protein